MKWQQDIWYGTSGTPSIGKDGIIYVTSSSKLFAIYPNNGTLKWTYNAGSSMSGMCPLISDDGIIYVGSEIGDGNGGELIAINLNGMEIWRIRICNMWCKSSPIMGEDGIIYVGSSWDEDNGGWTGYLHASGELDPNAPAAPTITGELNGRIRVEYEYTFSSNDPNGDDVFYYIDWGDGEFTDWIGPYDSGQQITVSHTWSEKGTYNIKARAKDTDNLWGPWGELEVTMPMSQPSVNQQILKAIFQRLLSFRQNIF